MILTRHCKPVLGMSASEQPYSESAHAADAPPSSVMTRSVCARIPTIEGEFQLCHYTNTRDNKEHLALVLGDPHDGEDVLVRVHSECFTGDVLGSRRCDCGDQLHRAMELIAHAGRGVIIYLRQEGRGIGLAAKLRAYNLQDEGYDTVEANLLLGHQADEREYWAAAAILDDLRVRSINLLTNNPTKIEHLSQLGVLVNGRTPVVAEVHDDNRAYLTAKVQRMRHMLTVTGEALSDAAQAGTPAESPAPFPVLVEERLADLRRRIADNRTGRPFITLSYAQSLNGSIGGRGGLPLALSAPDSLRLTHTLRAAHNAILVGVGTVLADDPSLTVRLVDGPQPLPVVLDSALRMPPTARLLEHPRSVLVAASAVDPQRAALLQGRGVDILALPGEGGRIDLELLLAGLAQRGVRSVMVEGGAQVIAEFLRRRLVDAIVLTVAPRLVDGVNALAGDGWSEDGAEPALGSMPTLGDLHYTRLDNDLLVWATPVWNEAAHE